MPQVPKREAELARDRSRKGGEQKTTFKLELQPVTIPNVPKSWHPVARRLFNSLKTSGQSDRFQDSDWAYAYLICEEISSYKREEDLRELQVKAQADWYATPEEDRLTDNPPRVSSKGGSAMKMTALIDSLARLGVTEVDRLKVRIELKEPEVEEVDAEVVAINDWKTRLGG